ncbi:MAG: hypothetical protein ACI8XB_000704 [Patiriisocius sp.]|jgi:hypothetical protein
MKKQLLSLALIILTSAGINAQILLSDNMDSYDLGAIGPQADHWTTWSGTEGGAEDGIVTDEQAATGANSMLIAEGGAQDVILLLGDDATGTYNLTWNMYVPAGATGYYNFQGTPTPGEVFVQQVFLNNGGAAAGTFEVEGVGTASYPEDAWFVVKHSINLDTDEMEVFVNGVSAGVGPYVGATANLGGIDFFSIDAANRYYVDDISLLSFVDCAVPSALICDDFEMYTEGALGPQSADWTTWSGTEGGAEDGIVSIDYANSGVNSMVIEEGGAQDVILLLGDASSGRYSLSWNTYFEDLTSTGYYNFQGSPVIGAVFVQQFYFNAGGAAEGVYSNDLNASLTTFAAEEWFNINHIVDLDNDVMHVLVNGVVVMADIPYTDNLSSIDFFSIDAANRMYIDDVLLVALDPVVACDATDLLYCENFDEFTAGTAVGPWSDEWTTWSGTEGTSEDGIVSDEQAGSGANSMLIAEGGAQDVIFLMGDYDTGAYEVTFNMYVPAAATGYYNFQGTTTPGEVFVQQIFFNNGGAAAGTMEVEGVGTATYPEDAWFQVKHVIDLDGDVMEVFVNDVSAGSGAYTGATANLAAIDFFSIDASNRYYIDDVTIAEGVAGCSLGGADIVCDNIDTYALGSTTGENAEWWTTWSGTVGGAEDGIVSDEQAASGANSMLIAEGSAQDVVFKLGNQMDGAFAISWMMYVPADATGYYNIQETEVPGTAWNMDVFFNQGGGAPGVGTVITNGATFDYPTDQWFSVHQNVDMVNNVCALTIDGVEIFDDLEYMGNLGGINFFSIDATNRYYIDDILYSEGAVSIDELSSSALSIYPNPNNGEFTIVNDDKAGLYTLRVTDLTGRAIMNEAVSLGSGTAHVVRLNDVTAGVYVVQLVNEDNSAVRIVKMIVE